MSRLFFAAAFAVTILVGGASLAKDGKDDVVGTIWSYTITRGEKVEKGQFRCHDLKLYKGQTQVGEVQPQTKTHSTLVFTDFGELNGTIDIRKSNRKPPVWRGTLERENGRTWSIVIRIKDR